MSFDDLTRRFCGSVRVLMIVLPMPFLIPMTGWINPLWSALFALPSWLVVRVFQPHPVYGPHPLTETAGILLWPPILLFLMIWGSQKLLLAKGQWRQLVILAWLISVFIIIPDRVLIEHCRQWPVFGVWD